MNLETISQTHIAAIEEVVCCPFTIVQQTFCGIFMNDDRIMLVFHTEHGDFRWKVKRDATQILNAIRWFRKCQD